MSRWIAFDQDTAQALESKIGARVELSSAADDAPPVVMAARAPGPAVAVLPAPEPGHALLLRFTHLPPPQPEAATNASPRFAPGGFLGLADEVVLEDEPQPPRKWWQKLLD